MSTKLVSTMVIHKIISNAGRGYTELQTFETMHLSSTIHKETIQSSFITHRCYLQIDTVDQLLPLIPTRSFYEMMLSTMTI
jgi:hypothetical protein